MIADDKPLWTTSSRRCVMKKRDEEEGTYEKKIHTAYCHDDTSPVWLRDAEKRGN